MASREVRFWGESKSRRSRFYISVRYGSHLCAELAAHLGPRIPLIGSQDSDSLGLLPFFYPSSCIIDRRLDPFLYDPNRKGLRYVQRRGYRREDLDRVDKVVYK